ncbi:MAG: hypothetical protein NPIRA02_00670 [Nitrospirales bacterium]|nr:MAG: hypothetical protein NPIRA02_00670 [Nitrospirales bacterium]
MWAQDSPQQVDIVDDRTITVEVSQSGLTVFQLPDVVQKAVSSSRDVDVKFEGKYVMVTMGKDLADLVTLTKSGQAYVFVLHPTEQAAAMIAVIDHRKPVRPKVQKPDPIVREASGYVEQLTTIIQRAAKGTLPASYEQESIKDQPRYPWLALTIEEAQVFRGPRYQVVVYALKNDTDHRQTMQEREWNSGMQLAIAIQKEVIDPGQRTIVYLVEMTERNQKDESSL